MKLIKKIEKNQVPIAWAIIGISALMFLWKCKLDNFKLDQENQLSIMQRHSKNTRNWIHSLLNPLK